MVQIISDNQQIKENIQDLVEGIEETGGGFHSKLIIKEEDGQLSVCLPEDVPPGKEIIRIKRQSTLPSDRYNISVKGEQFALNFPEETTLTETQKKLIEAKINLYNLTDKLKNFKQTSLFYGLRESEKLTEKISESRSLPATITKQIEKLKTDLKADEEEALLVEGFLKTRHLGYNDPIRQAHVSIIMPVIDFLNHHWAGAGFGVASRINAGDIFIDGVFPHKNSRECYAFYGPMDAMDTLIRYDFVDTESPVVRSVPLTLDLPKGYQIKVLSEFSGFHKKVDQNLADIKNYVPSFSYDRENKKIQLSHLFIPNELSPLALRRILNTAIAGSGMLDKNEELNSIVSMIEETVIEKNIMYYNDLENMIKSTSDNMPDAVKQMLMNTVKTQKDKILSYQQQKKAA